MTKFDDYRILDLLLKGDGSIEKRNLRFSSSFHCKVKLSEEIDGPGNRPVLFAGRKADTGKSVRRFL